MFRWLMTLWITAIINLNILNGFMNSIQFKALQSKSSTNLYNEWYEMEGCWVLLPENRVPKSIIHFVGGFIAGSSVSIAYSSLLEEFSKNGHLIVATPIPALETNHQSVALSVASLFSKCYSLRLLPLLRSASGEVPIIGVSHSLGGKLIALMHSEKSIRKLIPRRYANIYLAFNNYDLKESFKYSLTQVDTERINDVMNSIRTTTSTIQDVVNSISNSDLGNLAGNLFGENNFNNILQNLKINDNNDIINNGLRSAENILAKMEFIPTASETWNQLENGYNIQKNYFIKFQNDTIDQSYEAAKSMMKRGCDANIIILPGNHLTPNYIEDINVSDKQSTDKLLKNQYFMDESTPFILQNSEIKTLVKELTKLLDHISTEGWGNPLQDSDYQLRN